MWSGPKHDAKKGLRFRFRCCGKSLTSQASSRKVGDFSEKDDALEDHPEKLETFRKKMMRWKIIPKSCGQRRCARRSP
jgi:hypothetical protein